MATGRPKKYHLKGFAFALQVFLVLVALHLVLHEDNAYIPSILHWRSNSSARFHELMSQVFENHEGKLVSNELRTLKRDFQRTKDELANVARSNKALHNRVHELEEMVRNESLKLEREFAKSKKCVEDFGKTLA
ncbi:unnamed protein product [Prunus armeniaca]